MRRNHSAPWSRWAGFVLLLLAARASAAELSQSILAGGNLQAVDVQEGTPRVERLASGADALRFDAAFHLRIDLKPKALEAKNFDLLKLEVKADRAAFLRIAIENHPRIGDVSYWYVLDGMRDAFDWKTIWVDLKVPEEIKAANDHRSPWREGLGKGSEDLRGVQIQGMVKDLKSQSQGPGRTIRIGDVRLVKKAIDLDWDQTQAPYTWSKGKDLVFTYPLTLKNKLDQPVTARLALQPVEVEHATAKIPEEVALDAGETKTVEAQIRLPAAVAAKQDPLYCERFLVTAEAKSIADSTITVVRSSDPIHLTVTVPIDDDKLAFPMFPRPSQLPASVLRFDSEVARGHAAKDPKPLIETALQHGLYQYGSDSDPHKVGQYRQTLLSAAYLYDMTGEEKYLRTAETLLKALPTIWKKWFEEYEKEPVRIISSGIVARWKDLSHYTLGMGWLVMGTQRGPYYYGVNGNGRGGSMGSLAYAFDIIAPQLDENERQDIIQGFFLPAAIQARNHYIGDGNQQMTADLTAMYGGLVARNWPLVSFGYSSQHGLLEVLNESFDDEGVQLRKNYQTYTLRPILWATELLHGVGFDLYKKHGQRLTQIVNADPRAKNQGAPFEDREFWQFLKDQRLK